MCTCITLVVTHKECDLPKNDGYLPIIVGGKVLNIDGAVMDNTGENISSLNKNFCELTAQYWFWKNWKTPYDYVGLAHYRRFLSTSILNNSQKFISQSNIDKALKHSDILLPKPFYWKYDVATVYNKGSGRLEDLYKTGVVIAKIYPQYLNTYDKQLKTNKGSYCNMFYMKKADFEEYSKWLFDILFELNNDMDLSGYSSSEARIYGYLSEILLNVWVRYNHKKVCYVPMIETEKNKSVIRRIIDSIKNKIRSLVFMFYNL